MLGLQGGGLGDMLCPFSLSFCLAGLDTFGGEEQECPKELGNKREHLPREPRMGTGAEVTWFLVAG